MAYIVDIFIRMVLILYVLLVGKCCFEESFLLDKKVFLVNLATDILYMMVHNLFGENSIPFYVADILDTIVLGWTILRGGRGFIRRIKAFLQVFFFLVTPIAAIACILDMQFGTYIQLGAKSEDIIMNIAVMLILIEMVFVYCVLYKKQISLNYSPHCGECV